MERAAEWRDRRHDLHRLRITAETQRAQSQKKQIFRSAVVL